MKKTLTNAEHIRIMTDEELADFIIDGCWGEKSKKMEKSEVIEWLTKEDSIPVNEDLKEACGDNRNGILDFQEH